MKKSRIMWLLIIFTIHYIALNYGIMNFLYTYFLYNIIVMFIITNSEYDISTDNRIDIIKLKNSIISQPYLYLSTGAFLFAFISITWYFSVKILNVLIQLNNNIDNFNVKRCIKIVKLKFLRYINILRF